MNKKIIVVGGGIAGLSSAIYAKSCGFDVTIMEQHNILGGMCTSWKRKGYLFEGAVHWLTGSSPKTKLNKLWKQTGALNENTHIYYSDVFSSLEYEGEIIYLYSNMEKLKKHLIEVSPQDEKNINRLIKSVNAMSKMEMPSMDVKGLKTKTPEKMGASDIFKMIPAMPAFSKLNKISVEEYLSSFSHKGIKELFSIVPGEYSATALIFTLATIAVGDGGYPQGGSLEMVKRMEEKYKAMGGKVELQTKVQKVVVQDGVAVGVTVNDTLIKSDAVIVTAETLSAFDNLFDIPLVDDWAIDLQKNTIPAICCFVGLGIKEEIKVLPEFYLKKPINCGGITYNTLAFHNYNEYKDYAPQGCTAITTALVGDSYEYWKKAKEEGRYEEEKQRVLEEICNALCEKYPNFKDKIEVKDLATPLTYERYTSANKGSWMSISKPNDMTSQSCPCKLSNAQGVFFAGHRTLKPGGLPVALMSGRTAVQLACVYFDEEFIPPAV